MTDRLSKWGLVCLLSVLIVSGFGVAPVSARSMSTYTVRPGDTLIGIAARHNVRVSQLADANGLRWNSWVYVGQRLVIPASPAGSDNVHVVRRGDTLSAISRRYGTTGRALMQANRLTATRIYPGQRLIVRRSPCDSDSQYAVRWGDTLSAIARRYGTTVRAIMSANDLRTTIIHVSQRLDIPGHDAAAADSDWESYSNRNYAFAFRYPDSWTLQEQSNQVKLDRGTLRLIIAFQRRGEDVPFPWTGMPAGDFVDRGTGQFLGQKLKKHQLVFEGKVKVLTYSAEVDGLLFEFRLDDRASGDYRVVNIPEGTKAEVDRIVASFVNTGGVR